MKFLKLIHKEHFFQWGVTPLIDNFVDDTYYYLITVYTGMRRGAGTRSRVGFIVAGEDDGSFFIWERDTTNIVRVLRGDDSIVNCLQPHPTQCLLATSGIDPVVRLWSPRVEVKQNKSGSSA